MKGQKAFKRAMEFYNSMYKNSSKLKDEASLETYKKALSLIRVAAYQGHPDAQFELGQQYEDVSFLGVENPYHDSQKMFYWYTKACNNNHAEACNALAIMYESGVSCQKNINKALSLYKKSSELGSSLGQKNYKLTLKQLSES